MVPSAALQLQIATLINGDTTTLASAIANKVKLAVSPFTPGPNLDPSSLTEASFTGYAAVDPTAGAQNIFVDPLSGLITISFKAPAGGFHYQCTGSTGLPQTVFGWYITDSTGATLYGSGLLDTPIPITASGQGLDLPDLTFQFSNNSPS